MARRHPTERPLGRVGDEGPGCAQAPDARARALRAALLARRTDIDARLARDLAAARAQQGRAADDIDVSSDHLQDEIAFAAIQAHSDLRRRIEEALDRLDAGQYGRCRECGDAIADARLRALPFAVRCVACERRCEGRLRQSIGPRGGPSPHERA